MSRSIEHQARYPASPAALHAAVTDEAYWRARVAAVGGRGATLDALDVVDGTITVRLTQKIAAEHLPSIVQKISSGDLAVQRTEFWGALQDSGSAGTFTAEVPGRPITMRGRHAITGDDSSCTARSSGEVRVSVPLIGGKIEAIIAENITELLVVEQRFTAQWLAEH